jgi:DNA polymerase III epsilon subunit-like protein
MKVLVFDTETTNLIKRDLSDVYIIQISWIVFNTETYEQEENDFVLKVPVKIKNSSIHGISKEISNNGYYINEIIDIFLEDVKKCDVLIGHNLQFDMNMVEIELRRLGLEDEIDMLYSKRYFDTMREGKKYLKEKKFPKLQELYTTLFNKKFENAHNALFDVRATLRCYLKIKN